MLSPDLAASRWILGVVLVAMVTVLVVRAIRKDRREYSRFKNYRSTRSRQRMLRRWLLGSFALFGTMALVSLVLAWQYVPLVLAAARRWPISVSFARFIDNSGGLVPGIAVGVALALVFGTVLAVYLARRSIDVPTMGDISALLPRNRQELVLGAALSVNAGVVEELVFRFALPAVMFAVTGNAVVSIVLSIVFFGVLHAYQGVVGVVGTAVIGAVLMALYLTTGSIVVPIVAHALIDLRSLVLIPVVVFGVHKKVA